LSTMFYVQCRSNAPYAAPP